MGQKYGFIGLGSMGFGMCSNIHAKIKPDDQLYICDINQAALDRFVEESKGKARVEILKTPKDVAEQGDIIITMLPKSEHVQQVYYAGKNNILSAGPGTAKRTLPRLFVECSTIDPAVSRDVGGRIIDAGLGDYADAAVSGGPFGAAQGTLSHMIGCDEAILDRVKAVLHMTGCADTLFHCGPVGTGVTVKLINNYLSVSNILLASEAFNLGARMGIDPTRLTEIVNASSGASWITQKNHPVPGVQADSVASRGYKGGFAIELAAGCIELANKMACDVGAKMVLGPTTEKAWEEAMRDPRCRGLDARSIKQHVQFPFMLLFWRRF